MKLRFWQRYSKGWHEYVPDAISYHAMEYKVDGYPSGDSDFEEEKILGMYLSNIDLRFARLVFTDLNSPFVKEKYIGSESWDAEIIGDKVEMRFAFAEDAQTMKTMPPFSPCHAEKSPMRQQNG